MTTEDAPLMDRAIDAARYYLDTAKREFLTRHQDLTRWQHRSHSAVTLATVLGVPVDDVSVRDDPGRHYGLTRRTPGDLFEVAADGCWYFVPDLSAQPDRSWLLLGECPRCSAEHVPVARIANLIDLGDHAHAVEADLDNGGDGMDRMPVEFYGDPGHHTTCPYGNTAH